MKKYIWIIVLLAVLLVPFRIQTIPDNCAEYGSESNIIVVSSISYKFVRWGARNGYHTSFFVFPLSFFSLDELKICEITHGHMGEMAKPVIYLYPEAETEVSVMLDLHGQLTCTYPAYKNGWHVTARPDGTLTDASGMEYNYLYWEGTSDTEYDLSQGFCVKGEDTAAFLEDALARLGLNRREANEFIVYWLPLMQDNPYNIISFQAEAYTDCAALHISPTPDTVIRVFMAWHSADEYQAITPQELTAPERTGFTVVEWGGTQLPAAH